MYELEPGDERPDHITVGLIDADVPFTSSGTRDETVMDHYQDAIGAALEAEPDILVGAEYVFFPYEPLTREEKDARFDVMRELSEEHPDTLLMPGTYIWKEEGQLHNTLPVFHRGELVFTYEKQNPANAERWMESDHKLAYTAEKSEGVLEYQGLSVGMEICYDHTAHTLRDKGVRDLDLQVLVANGKDFIDTATMVKEGGYHLRVDGSDSSWYHGVEVHKCVGPYKYETVGPERVSELPHDMKLDLYNLDMV